MYFPRLYPDELLYSGIARCRVHLGIGNHKTLLHMHFGDSKVAAITDLPTHLAALANNTGLDAEGMILNHTLFPLYAPFIPPERRTELFQAMLAPDRSTIGLSGASTALVKWPDWLRYCPICFEDMAARYGEPYWRRSWQIQGIDACPEHGCQLLNSPIPFRRAQRHEFHPASPLFLPRDLRVSHLGEEAIRLAKAATQLLSLEEVQSPGYGRWTNLYRYLATECGARRGRQVRAEVIWEKILASHLRNWLAANSLLTSGESPPWLLAMFRKHRNGFSALQHLVIWNTLRPEQNVDELIHEANTRQASASTSNYWKQLPAEEEKKQQYRLFWLQALDLHGGAKPARQNGGKSYYAWLYRHDRKWLVVTNQARHFRQGNNSHVDWRARDKKLVRLLVRIGRDSEANLRLPRRSRNWFLQQLPHRASVEHHLDQMPLCRTFLDRYAESVGEYQIRRLSAAMLDDVQTGTSSKRWQLEKCCGLDKSRMTTLTTAFLGLIGMMD
ncbi:Transposon Tn7 transposition protein TnsD [Pseudomonas savastanoi pv. glycinea]|uniref:Transposon Tn7 transposition protein TnsD n=1 Tax=Pseudomonas savastanoi pv. glycinea TaxID=318 RepID=A0A3M3UMU5_PSESG|nr:TnsD family Tn7-like transposition protein [Pseudomonas savastanoi]RMO34514.1 Transposon Tn7 transposition protein TnsD [Pseudomonas savastanoi pv. glycinea]